MNTDILGISELKWMGMGEFNSDDHYIYYRSEESLRRNRVALIVNKSPKHSTWMQSQKQQNDLSLFTRSLIHYSNPFMPKPLTLNKLTLTSSLKTYKIF